MQPVAKVWKKKEQSGRLESYSCTGQTHDSGLDRKDGHEGSQNGKE